MSKLRDFIDSDGDNWFEVTPGKGFWADTRAEAEKYYAKYPDRALDISIARDVADIKEK